MKDYPNTLHWQMGAAERYALTSLLREIKPKLSIEIGTYKGGSLQVISHFSDEVISIDIDPEVGDSLKGMFTNVDLRIGDSHQLLNELILDLNNRGISPDFVLVDGDHSEHGVRKDIEILFSNIMSVFYFKSKQV
jgi:cephalosporin hydroxylase